MRQSICMQQLNDSDHKRLNLSNGTMEMQRKNWARESKRPELGFGH
jgi:hypothetical protein